MKLGLIVPFFFVACSTKVPSSPAPHVIANPELRLLVWGDQDPKPLENDWRALFAGGVLDRLAEYGVHGGSLGMTITAMPGLQPAVFDDLWIAGQVFSEFDGVPPERTVWMVVLPPGSSTIEMQAAKSEGYHYWLGVPLAVVASGVERVISHELYEAATDPDGLGYRWNGEEVGDLCEGQTEIIAGVSVQKVWSAAKGACE